MLNFVFFLKNWQLASKVGIESVSKIEETCGLLGKVMEWRTTVPGFNS